MKNKFLGFPFGLVLLAGISFLPSAFAQTATAQTQGSAQRAESKISMCVGCHAIPGYKTAFPTVYSVPKIGGQTEAYIANALRSYKKGERTHPSMRGIAASLSETDILDLAAYYSQQR